MARTGQIEYRDIKERFRHGMRIGMLVLVAMLSLSPATLLAGTADLIGAPAPDFALRSTAGNNLRLSEYRSDVVVLNFWSEWCGKCAAAVSALNEFDSQYGDAGLRVLTIDVDGNHGQHLVDEAGLTYPVLLDVKSRVSKAYDLNRLPVTVLIDREGTVRYVQKGFKGNANQQLSVELNALLQE